MAKPKLHDQEWRDFQPVSDPESTVEKFKAALERAQARRAEKSKVLTNLVRAAGGARKSLTKSQSG
ncbi:MAG: hypothetical protein ABSD98_08350 [Candidatus Korobacteraceae bacterium]|jgi:hypothetical protein